MSKCVMCDNDIYKEGLCKFHYQEKISVKNFVFRELSKKFDKQLKAKYASIDKKFK